MITITSEQLAEAEAQSEAAEQGRLVAERAFATGRAISSTEKVFADATVAAAHAAARVRTLRRDYEEQTAVREARTAAERDAAAGAAETAGRLAVTREAAVRAVQGAEAAMAKALAAVGAHDTAVRAASAGLRARGLTLDDSEAMGGTRGGGLVLGDGEHWAPVDAPSLLEHSLIGLVAAHYPGHPLGRSSRALLGGASAAAGRRALLGEESGA